MPTWIFSILGCEIAQVKIDEVLYLARKLRRKRPKGGQLSLSCIAKELATRGF
jgi:hypothetical protein